MKTIKRKKSREVAVAPTVDYESLLVNHNGDPFAFLSSLKAGNSRASREMDPEAIAGGKAMREGGSFNEGSLEKEVDIAKMIRGVIDDNSLVPKDVKIDDGDLPLAKNFYEWTTDDNYAGTVMTPFLEQLIWGIVVFGEWCPVCSDNEYLLETHGVGDTFTKFLTKVCLLENGVCPSCHGTKSEFVKNEAMNFYQELAVNAGQRSGKSACVGGMLTPYMTHRILKMQKPNAVYGIASSTMLHGTFCALTYAQAKDTLWQFYYGTLCESNWFKEYHAMLRFYENRYGQSLLKFNDTFVVYRPRSLMFYPAGPDKRVLRGKTRIFAGIDEIGYFDNDANSQKVKTSAHHVYDALDASLLTIRGAAERLISSGHNDILTGYSMNVSSPSSQQDKICSLVRQAQDSKSMYGIHRPTWEVNPTLPRNSKVIKEAYTRAPLDAERNYGANPPLSANPFIANPDFVQNSIGKKRNPIQLKPIVLNRKKSGKATKWAEITKIGKTHKASMLTIDAGLTDNSFAVTCGRIDKDGILVIDLMCEIMPEPGIPLNYTMIMDDILDPIIIARNVKVVLADRWNSVKLLQDIEESHANTVADQYSLKYRDLHLLKSYMEGMQLVLPRFENEGSTAISVTKFDGAEYPKCFAKTPVEHLAAQMLTVQDTGTQVNKGGGLTDDLWRAACLLTWGLTQEKYQELMIDASPDTVRPQAFGASKLGSGGGKSLGGGSMSSAQGQMGMWKGGR